MDLRIALDSVLLCSDDNAVDWMKKKCRSTSDGEEVLLILNAAKGRDEDACGERGGRGQEHIDVL